MSAAIPGDRRTVGADGEDTLEDSQPVRVVVSGDETAGRYAIVETLARQGSEPPLHLHTREDELVYVLEGSVLFLMDGERLQAARGERVFLPGGCEHTYRVESGEASLLVVLTPAGLEALYRELDALTRDMDRLVTVSARYGVEITGSNPLMTRGGDGRSG